jgi:hypothetical protein
VRFRRQATQRVPHRPGTAPALGLRAGRDGLFVLSQTSFSREICVMGFPLIRNVFSRSKRQATVRLTVEQLEERNTPGVTPAAFPDAAEFSPPAAVPTGIGAPPFHGGLFTPPALGNPQTAPPFLDTGFLPPASFVTLPALASLSGVVTDSATGAALGNVTITLTTAADQPMTFTTITNADGRYSLTGLPAGTYTATATLPGYQSETVVNVFESAGANTILNFALAPAPASLSRA